MSVIRDRVWAVDIIPKQGRASRYEGARIAFDVASTDGKGSTCRLSYTMPPRALLGELAEPGAEVRILAGTAATGLVEIHRGRIAPQGVTRRRAGGSSVSVVTHASSRPLRIMLTEYLPGRQTAYAVAVAIASAIGVGVESIDDSLTSIVLERGYALVGPPDVLLDELAESAGCQWDLDGEQLAIWRIGQPRTVAVDLWRPGSGLLDVSGTAGQGEIRASALLRPAVRPGTIIRLESPEYRGDVVVSDVIHRGDTHSASSWSTHIVGAPRGV